MNNIINLHPPRQPLPDRLASYGSRVSRRLEHHIARMLTHPGHPLYPAFDAARGQLKAAQATAMNAVYYGCLPEGDAERFVNLAQAPWPAPVPTPHPAVVSATMTGGCLLQPVALYRS